MSAVKVPASTYRLQFNRGFTYADASAIVPYLHALGISHVYASPLLRARAGSSHGYDIVDHNSFNPEIGDLDAFDGFVASLRRHDMGLILDIVPNHMDVGGDNDWWQDVLEHGEASPYASFFDIDWHPVKPGLRHKVLLPVLGDHYGNVLERGELALALDAEAGVFGVRYYEHRFPLDPRSYGQIFAIALPALQRELGAQSDTASAIAVLGEAFRGLPPVAARDAGSRREAAAAGKRQLAALCQRDAAALACLMATVARINGDCGVADCGALHRLLEAQPYRLAYWRVAADEINYRRFFDINELACVRMENPAVFESTHRLVRRLVARGSVDGLRIDHIDGLSDPLAYCERLQQALAEDLATPRDEDGAACYLLVEKILASHEQLPDNWPIAGTTGYEVAQLLNGLFVAPDSETLLSRQYRRFTGQRQAFDDIVYECKKIVIFHALSSELTVLANLVNEIAQADPHTRDFTYHGLREALAELVARFPVYRTYLAGGEAEAQDRRYVHWALSQAKKHSRAADTQIFDFIAGLLLSAAGDRVARFVARFQQYTAPVTAKAVEDTACYVYNRLTALNEVGASPSLYGVSPHAFHNAVQQRSQAWPDAMVSTSTHDAKRSEDVRTRIDVLSEMPEEWRRHVARWSRVNRARKRLVGDLPAPSRNDEYFIYQTLIGVWPLQDAAPAGFQERIQAYVIKAVKEAKVNTSWLNPDAAYEAAVEHFVAALLRNPGRNAFLADFVPFQRAVARFGMLNSLSQTLLKLGLPGVPDTYQGNEVWTFSLVDPDNRRAVDYRRREAMLQDLQSRCRERTHHGALLDEMLAELGDGRAKLYLSWRALRLRREMRGFFRAADYVGLSASGARADHLVAFARRHEGQSVICAAGRWYSRLTRDLDQLPCGESWSDTWLPLPGGREAQRFRELLSGRTIVSRALDDGHGLDAAELFAHWPVALLRQEDR
jgi:(1->4)-alpha-D-glucan 1-alpha-D-glucosylmutase